MLIKVFILTSIIKVKAALHRLLYSNFVDHLSEDEYLKFTCDNKGKCCNIYHMKKFKYTKPIKKTNSASNIKKFNHTVPVKPVNFTLSFD